MNQNCKCDSNVENLVHSTHTFDQNQVNLLHQQHLDGQNLYFVTVIELKLHFFEKPQKTLVEEKGEISNRGKVPNYPTQKHLYNLLFKNTTIKRPSSS